MIVVTRVARIATVGAVLTAALALNVQQAHAQG